MEWESYIDCCIADLLCQVYINVYFFVAVWFGVIFIRHGLYQDGVFKFTVYIPDNYPDGDCPVSTVYTLLFLLFPLNFLP